MEDHCHLVLVILTSQNKTGLLAYLTPLHLDRGCSSLHCAPVVRQESLISDKKLFPLSESITFAIICGQQGNHGSLLA